MLSRFKVRQTGQSDISRGAGKSLSAMKESRNVIQRALPAPSAARKPEQMIALDDDDFGKY